MIHLFYNVLNVSSHLNNRIPSIRQILAKSLEEKT